MNRKISNLFVLWEKVFYFSLSSITNAHRGIDWKPSNEIKLSD